METKKMLFGMCLLPLFVSAQTPTLDECQTAARENYPLTRKYGLIEKTAECTVANLKRGWLPQISASAQATYQSDVVNFPDALTDMLKAYGTDVKGLKKDQYRIGIDINQTVYDGGQIRNQKEIARLQAEAERAQNDADLYAIADRVNNLYFGALLMDEKLRLADDILKQLTANEQKLENMLKSGIAMQSDVNTIKAERLKVQQQKTELLASRKSLLRMLAAFCGKEEISGVIKPSLPELPSGENNRPELRSLDALLRLTDAQEKSLNVGLHPRLSIFAQGFYGYPGYDMYHDMFEHNWTLNGTVGARLTWNLHSFYMRKNDKSKLALQRENTENQRDVFLFNNNLQQIENQEKIEKFQQLMSEDREIAELREQVRLSAEAKLNQGIIDVNDLLQEITQENNAKTNLSIREIEMLKSMYDLKFTINN